MLPRTHSQQNVQLRPARRLLRPKKGRILVRITVRPKRTRRLLFHSRRCIGIPCPETRRVSPQPLIHRICAFLSFHHPRVLVRRHVARDARVRGVHVEGLLAEMRARIRGSGVVGGEDGEFHAGINGRSGTFHEPDITGAEHGLGG